MSARRKKIVSYATGCFCLLIGIAGTNAFAHFLLDKTFPKHSYQNPEYNPSAPPEYAEICNYSYGAGEACGEDLLNWRDYERVLYYREFISEPVATLLVGHNRWDEDEVIDVFLVIWAAVIATTWFGAKQLWGEQRTET